MGLRKKVSTQGKANGTLRTPVRLRPSPLGTEKDNRREKEMKRATAVRASLIVATEEEESSLISLQGGITVEVWSEDDSSNGGVNAQAAKDELSKKLVDWATSFLGYDETIKIVIRPVA